VPKGIFWACCTGLKSSASSAFRLASSSLAFFCSSRARSFASWEPMRVSIGTGSECDVWRTVSLLLPAIDCCCWTNLTACCAFAPFFCVDILLSARPFAPDRKDLYVFHPKGLFLQLSGRRWGSTHQRKLAHLVFLDLGAASRRFCIFRRHPGASMPESEARWMDGENEMTVGCSSPPVGPFVIWSEVQIQSGRVLVDMDY
jgi:hypothetical protein